jgi:hypothetical protein
MKGLKVSLVFMVAALLTVGVTGLAYAFHSGGVAECEGCHSMHSPKAGGSYLLVGFDNSSTCLSCHMHEGDTGPSSYHIATADADLATLGRPIQRTPGGDFGWVRKTYTYGTVTYEEGYTHGHNIVAQDFGFVADPVNTVAPGGTYSSANLACTSCHDPHGKGRRLSDGTYATTGAPIIGSGSYDNSAVPAAGQAVGLYRLLRSPLYAGFGAYPIAVAPATYNRTEAVTQTRVAYGASGTNTWGNWCASCHPAMHSSGNYVHPVDQNLGSTIAGIYNTYVKSGDLTGSAANSYLSLVPFAENTGDFTTLASHAKNNDSVLAGPATADKVMCFSCHRAHASGMLHGMRFDQGYEFMVKNGQYIGMDNPAVGTTGRGPTQARGKLIADWQAAYYDRPATIWATYQRVLCNKCHAKD